MQKAVLGEIIVASFIFRYFAFSLLGILHSNLKYRFPVLVSSVPPRGAEELATSWKELERPKLVAAVQSFVTAARSQPVSSKQAMSAASVQ